MEFILLHGADASTHCAGPKLRLFGAVASYCENETESDVALPPQPVEIKSGAPSPLKSINSVSVPVPPAMAPETAPLMPTLPDAIWAAWAMASTRVRAVETK